MTTVHEDIEVLISTSPIESHPSTAIIEETLGSIRYHLPDSLIYLMLDGVREEQKHHTARYMEYIRRLALHVLHNEKKICLVPFVKFTHQARMTMKTLEMVDTPFVMMVEHDTPLMERPIDWEFLKKSIGCGETNHIRLHYDEQIHPEHEHLMCGKLGEFLIKCIQFHNRPYLTHADWFRSLLAANFNEHSLTFLEDRLYSPISCAPWEDYRLTIYDPEGTGQNMKRSRDLNGRGGEPKYSMVF